jgi:serine phosphatase RsbU (regulator of sigma subunit)
MAAQSGEGAVDLFSQHGAGKFVGKGHGREGEQEIRAGAPFGGKAIMAAEKEDEVAAEGFAFLDHLNEPGAVVEFASGVEENLVRGGVAGEEIVAAGVDFTHGDGGPALGAFEKLGGYGIRVFVAGFTDKEQFNPHSRYYKCSTHMPTELTIRTQDGSTRSVPLKDQSISLGRATTNELCYPEDFGLSRQHLVFERNGNDWQVKDLGSKNGTLVNGFRIAAATPLSNGDLILAGHLQMTFGGLDPVDTMSQTVVFVEKADVESAPSNTVVSKLTEVNPAQSLTNDRHAAALVRAGRELAGHRPLNELFQLILDLSVEAVGGSRAVLMTLEGEELVPRANRGEGFRISKTVRDQVIREKASLLVRDTAMDDVFKLQASIVMQRVRSFMAVPLQTNEKVIGLLYIDMPDITREFSKEDLSLLTVMANVAAIRIEHARLNEVEQAERMMAKELGQAGEIQRRLLPAAAPKVAGMDLAGYNVPCRTVGGDYFDFFQLPNNKVALVVGDVAGKGMPAAMLMSSLQARLQILMETSESPAEIVTKLNRSISGNCPDNRFITFFLAIVDPATGETSYCNAGHNPPILVRASGMSEMLEGGGIILGILPIAQYSEHRTEMRSGDTLVLFSDGVSEAMPAGSDEEFGEGRISMSILNRASAPAERMIEGVLEDLQVWCAGAPYADDVTLLIAKKL